jgi:PPOX class probable F420-dependent enzyme
MPAPIPAQYLDLFEKPAFGFLGTVMPDGSPQVTPIWVGYDGRHVLVNTAKGRVKDRNMRANPNVSIAVIDPANPYRYVEVRGKVDEITEQGADDHINAQAKKYLGVDTYPYRQPGEVRVLFKVAPTRISSMG